MDCSEFRQLLDSYELLDEKQLSELNGHACECDECRAELEFFKSIINTSASIPYPNPPKSLIDDVNAVLDATPAPKSKLHIIRSVRSYATVAACLAVGIAVGLNHGYIKEHLDGTGTEGVIKETVTTRDGASTVPDVAGTDEPQRGDVKAEAESTTSTSKPKVDENVPVSAAEAKDVVKPDKTDNKPVKSADTNKAGQTENTTRISPAPNKTTEPAKSEKASEEKGTYTIAHENYYVPEDEAKSTSEPKKEENTKEDYSISKSGAQIAFGYYSGAENDKKNSAAMADYLLVEGKDMGAVVSSMSELGVTNASGFYMTSRSNFYKLLRVLDEKGVDYIYELQYNSGDNISFKLRYN